MYPEICSMSGLKMSYGILQMYKELYKGRPTEHASEILKEVKQAIRKYRDDRSENECKVVKSDHDGVVMLVTMPDWMQNEVEASEFFERCYFLECPNSQYDCTGKAFTSWYKVFRRRGTWMAYHRISYDV